MVPVFGMPGPLFACPPLGVQGYISVTEALMDTSLQFASSALYAVKAVGFAFLTASFPDWYEHGSASAAAQG